MNAEHATEPTVLLVDDEPELLELYETWLADACEVRTAECGQAALERVDDGVDVVFLDRRMPDLRGEEVLHEMRERGYDCQVAMLTAVQPEAEVVEMPFDDYLTKPVAETDIKSTIDVLLKRERYDEKSQRLFALASKRASLAASSDIDHSESEEYARLTERMEDLRTEVDEALDEVMGHDYAAGFVELGGD